MLALTGQTMFWSLVCAFCPDLSSFRVHLAFKFVGALWEFTGSPTLLLLPQRDRLLGGGTARGRPEHHYGRCYFRRLRENFVAWNPRTAPVYATAQSARCCHS